MQLHNVQRNTKRKYARSVGRGGKRGKTSGRGTKGQKARAGRKMRPEVRDVIMRIPKQRGYRFHSRFDPMTPVNLNVVEKHFSSGETVSPETLVEKKIISHRKGKTPSVKILSTGELTKKVSVKGCSFSAKAKEKMEKAGCTIS